MENCPVLTPLEPVVPEPDPHVVICLERGGGECYRSMNVRLSNGMSVSVAVVASLFELDPPSVALRQKFFPFGQVLIPEDGAFRKLQSVDDRGDMAYYEVLGSGLKPVETIAVESGATSHAARIGASYPGFLQPLQPVQPNGGSSYFGYQQPFGQQHPPGNGVIAPVQRHAGFGTAKPQNCTVRFAEGKLTGSSAASGYNAIIRTTPGAADMIVKVTPQDWSLDYVLGEVRKLCGDESVNLHYSHGPMLTDAEVEDFQFWGGSTGSRAKRVFFACKKLEVQAATGQPANRGSEKRRKSRIEDVRDDVMETQEKLSKLEEKIDSFCHERDRLKAQAAVLRTKLADFVCSFCSQPFRAPPVACTECRFVYCAACSERINREAHQRQLELGYEPDPEVDHSKCPRCNRARKLYAPISLVWDGLEDV